MQQNESIALKNGLIMLGIYGGLFPSAASASCHLGAQPVLQLIKSFTSVRDLVLLRLFHLGVCLAFIFEG